MMILISSEFAVAQERWPDKMGGYEWQGTRNKGQVRFTLRPKVTTFPQLETRIPVKSIIRKNDDFKKKQKTP